MQARQDRIYEEASALWRELFGEPPPIQADGSMMLDIIMRSLPEKGYERLRCSTISEPTAGRPH